MSGIQSERYTRTSSVNGGGSGLGLDLRVLEGLAGGEHALRVRACRVRNDMRDAGGLGVWSIAKLRMPAFWAYQVIIDESTLSL
jgi:hypothetical protein